MLIAVLNESTRVTDAEVQTMTRAAYYQMRYHFCPAWQLTVPTIMFFKDAKLIPPGGELLVVLDDSDQQGALGYHDLTPDGLPYSKVFAAATLDNGGSVLAGAFSVSGVFTHESGEMRLDQFCNEWWNVPDGTLIAKESGDPVESDSYPVHVDGQQVMVSNFILPAWSNPDTKPGTKVDHMGTAPGPFQMSKGGYTIVSSMGQVSQKFGAEYPGWKKPSKQAPASRTYRRLTQQTGFAAPPSPPADVPPATPQP